ncbi:hypothetical protein KBI23_23325 [bacterium]|nr:hypothetical protein [bacterium]MBP9809771.1 hypothetical protein [bacterium]
MTLKTALITELAAATGKKGNLPLQVGAKVAILQHKHLKCSPHGYVQFINGSYISVRAEDIEPVESDACERTFELYPNELRVVAIYQHEHFQPGTVARIIKLNWLNVAPKTHGIVIGVEAERILLQPVGAHKGAIVSVRPEDLNVESNDHNQSAQALTLQTSILAVLAALGGSAAIAQLTSLLATQVGLSNELEIERQLAVMANQGQISLTANRAAIILSAASLEPSVPRACQAGLKTAIEQLEKAKESLADAVRQAILGLSL